jgi:hypothetical protein
MDAITTVGLDLAKNVFQVHGIDGKGKVIVRLRLRRADVLRFFEQLRCLVGLEACASAHHWARAIAALGHPADDALRCDQDGEAASGADAAQDTRSAGAPAHHADQRNSGSSGGVWNGQRPGELEASNR